MQVDATGAPVIPVGALSGSLETLQRLRDLIMVRFAAKGMTHREIAVVMNVDHSTVTRRLKGIPPHVREKYEKQSLEGLA